MPRQIGPRHVTRGEMRRFLTDLIDGLDGACVFWACEGPDAPTVAMKTCTNCYMIKRARTLLAWLDGPEPVRIPVASRVRGDGC